jgi:hypothetical protein
MDSVEAFAFRGHRDTITLAYSYTYMFLSSQAVAYFSSVVMLSSWPAWIGMSLSSTVFPVRISGPF